jgi:hypothetical protein
MSEENLVDAVGGATAVHRVMARTFDAVLRRSIPGLVVIAAVMAGVWVFIGNKLPLGLGPSLGLGAVFVVALGLGVYQAFRTQAQIWYGSEWIVNDVELIRRAPNVPEIRLPRGEVKRIDQLPDGALIVHGATTQATIVVPAQVEDLDRITARLAAWSPLQPKASSQLLLTAGIAGAMLVALSLFFVFCQDDDGLCPLRRCLPGPCDLLSRCGPTEQAPRRPYEAIVLVHPVANDRRDRALLSHQGLSGSGGRPSCAAA